MATNKSTTRGSKTRTVKRPAKARTSKVSTRVTAVKAVAKQASKVKTNRLAFLSLNKLWLIAAVLFAALAVAAVILMEPASSSLTQTHLTRDVLLSQDSTIFIPADRPVFDLELRWAVAIVMALSVVLPVLYLTKLKDFYAERLANRRVLELRWLDLAVTSGLMVEIIAILSGYTDFVTLKLMVGAMVITGALGWLAEQQNEKGRRPVWSAFIISLFAGALPWLAIAAATVSTVLFGEVRSPWYVYAVGLTTLAGFVLLAVNQWNQHRRFRNWADYAVVERNYALISIVTKVAFAVILIVGLAK